MQEIILKPLDEDVLYNSIFESPNWGGLTNLLKPSSYKLIIEILQKVLESNISFVLVYVRLIDSLYLT